MVTNKLNRYFDADMSRPVPFAILAVAFVIARLPFVDYGHGTDPDAWRVAMTAHHLLDTGDYFPSRLPGNPLHELVMTLFIPAGWIGTNLATIAVSLLGVYLFALIVSHLRLPNSGLLCLGFAFTPLLFINSLATMDYMWSLTAILAAFYLVLRGWLPWAGLCLGLAIGFRLQSAIVYLPLAYLVWRQHNLLSILPMGFIAAATALVCFTPVLVVYGTDFYNFYDARVAAEDVLRLLGKEALGVLGGIGVLTGASLSLHRLRHLPADAVREPWLGAIMLLIVLYFVTFFRLPHEIAYLIPVFPAGILIIGRYFTRLAATGAIAAIILAGLVDITTPEDDIGVSGLGSAQIGKGLILSNANTMTLQRQFVEEVLAAEVPEHSVVMSGFVFPQLAVRERDRLEPRILQHDYGAISILSDRGEAIEKTRDVRYVWLLTYDAFLALRSQGYAFFQVPDAAGGAAALYDYRPALLGASFLRLDRAAPSSGKGTASTDR